MEMAAVSVATGAMKPVLGKLNSFLGDYTLPEGSQSDIEVIKSELESMHSLLPTIWEKEDLDAPCKDWMMEVRELSYDMEDDIDDFIQQRPNTSPFESLKNRVRDVSERFREEWKTTETISTSSKPVVDPRARFLHKDASELVGMDELKDQLIELLVQGLDKLRDASPRRIGTPHHGTKKAAQIRPKQKIVIKVLMASDKCRSKAMALVAATGGVDSVALDGKENRVVVVGDGVDPIKLVSALRKKVGPAQLVQVGEAKKEGLAAVDVVKYPSQPVAVNEHPTAADRYRQSRELKMVCILGFAGVGKTTLADLAYHAIGDRFQCRAFVSISPSPNMLEILTAILRDVTNERYYWYGVTAAATEQSLISSISYFLADKRYLVVIDDIWHWRDFEFIINSLPKNSMGSRIIMTTRINAIAEKCRNDCDAIVYEAKGLPADAAEALSERIINGSREAKFIPFKNPCRDMGNIPLAVICKSLAVAEQLERDSMSTATLEAFNVALRRVRDGFLNIPVLQPLLESLCRGYHDLPLHLKACLLHCSIYPGSYRFERDSLVRKWIAEGFVHEEETAEGCFDELVNRRLIEPVSGSEYGIHASSENKYEIHTIMLTVLRCKSQEENFVTCLGDDPDIPSSQTERIRRLSLQYAWDFSKKDLSHTRSLYVFDAANEVRFQDFGRLRVLDLEDNEDLKNDHLVDICGLLWLRYLGLKGTRISKIPPEIEGLQHLETLDVRDTQVRELPWWEAGQISKSLCVLAGGRDSRKGVRLPAGMPKPSLAKCREVLSIVVFDSFGMGPVSPHVGVVKVTGRHMHIPQLIKNEHFSVLPSLDIRLCTLDREGDDLKFLREMPNLQTLVLRLEVLPRKPIPISGEGFPMLESFYVDSRVPRVTFEPGAMPKLKHLAFKFYAGPESEHPVGIEHLRSLEKVVFRCSPWYKSDSRGISATLGVVRKEACKHPNRITLCINDKEEIFPEGSSQICELENRGSRSGTEEDKLDDDRNSLAGNGNKEETFQSGEIEEIEARE